MFLKNSLLRWIGIGVLSLSGIAISLKAFNLLAAAIPSPSIPLPLTSPEANFLPLPSEGKARGATLALNANQLSVAPKSDGSLTQQSPPVPTAHRIPLALIPVAKSPQIRVKVASSQTHLTIATSDPGAIALPDGTIALELIQGQPYLVSVGQGGLLVGSQVLPNGILLLPDADGFTWVEGHWYRGQVRLIWAAGQLHAINEVGLEPYLYGVVGAEMPPDWQDEALKAQAIAARSYALALMEQPSDVYWDIGNDESHQSYRGAATETSTTISAVEATRGAVLVKDGRIFLSQYASTDALSQSAHGGIGKSMSQTGAQRLAEQGATMFQILGYYYPGAGMGVLKPPGAS